MMDRIHSVQVLEGTMASTLIEARSLPLWLALSHTSWPSTTNYFALLGSIFRYLGSVLQEM
jgi:hypothetical protein